MRTWICMGIAAMAALSTTGAAAKLTCADVYSNAVVEIDSQAMARTEKSFYFNLYCQTSGSVKKFSSSAEASFPIKGIPVSVSGDGNLTQQELQNFCKQGVKQRLFESSDFGFRKYANVNALKSFNECRALEEKGLLISHQTAHPHSFNVYAEFKSVTGKGTLDAVEYNPDLMSCTSSNFDDKGRPEKLHGSIRKTIGKTNFNIKCTRKAFQSGADTYYPRATFQIATSWGPYTVILPGDRHFGFELASQAKASLAEALAKVSTANAAATANRGSADVLSNKLNKMLLISIYYGDGGWQGTSDVRVICPGTVPSNTATAATFCSVRNMALHRWKLIGSVGGGSCGHTWYAVVCVPR